MLKGMGALLLLGSALWLGLRLSAREQERLRQTEGLLLLLRHIRACIVCFADPIEEIYRRFQNRALEECGFLPALRTHGFAYALRVCDGLAQGDEVQTALASFADGVGKSNTREQAALCDYTVAVMEAALHRRQEEAPRRARLARGLALCGALALLVLLV